ncbi:MAG: S9 family peptidase, partial [bacterium]
MKRLARFLPVLLFAATVALAQSGDIAPGDNLVVEGIPKIPASVAEAVGRYTEFRSASLQSWHPTKREMLISTRFGDTNQVHHLRMPGGARTQLTFFPDRVGGASYQPTRGDFFIFSKDVGGGEWFQGYRYDLSTGAISLLTDGGRSQNSGGVWSTAGDRIAYSSTRRNGKDRDLWVMNPTDPKTDRMLLQVEGGGWGVSDWSPDDKSVAIGEFLSVNESYIWLVDVATGEKTLLTPKGGSEKVAYGGAEFSKDGKGLYLTTDKDSEFQRLAYRDLATKQLTYLTSHINWDVDGFELSPDGKTIAFVANEDGASVLHLLDTRTRKEKPVPKLPLGQVFGIEWHKNSRELGFTLVSARSTADVYSLDVQTGKVERWTASETGGLSTESFSEPELIKWKTFDGKTISGYLYRPPARFTGKRAVVINIHGGPEGQFRPVFSPFLQYCVRALGIAVIAPNV